MERESLFPAVRRHRKKPVVIEAMQLRTDDDLTTANQWIAQEGGQSAISYDDALDVTVLVIFTLEGDMSARWDAGDWIIRGVQGEFYPCKADIFAATYDAAEPETTRQARSTEGWSALEFYGFILRSLGIPASFTFDFDTGEWVAEGPYTPASPDLLLKASHYA